MFYMLPWFCNQIADRQTLKIDKNLEKPRLRLRKMVMPFYHNRKKEVSHSAA